ncbi:oligopeptide/dipeptide ABC transporter ATP-binding protein [Streptomyces sp. NPDC060031]|uniref:oligopeptide/dipeptide ABC transporter ATP-binding protein n=1 Tax=Streptomyces sp. NPDC060031 TaxID=3347043 RepID=UPI0036CB5351
MTIGHAGSHLSVGHSLTDLSVRSHDSSHPPPDWIFSRSGAPPHPPGPAPPGPRRGRRRRRRDGRPRGGVGLRHLPRRPRPAAARRAGPRNPAAPLPGPPAAARRRAHPGTRALLAATPRPQAPPGPLPAMPGRPADLRAVLAGCAFTPRCARATELCGAEVPAPHAGVACHHPEALL